MIHQDGLNRITVNPTAGQFIWTGIFIGIPNQEDVRDAIEYDIEKLQENDVEHERDEADSYVLAHAVLLQANFNRVSETVVIAGVEIGSITCERVDCFVVGPNTLRSAQ